MDKAQLIAWINDMPDDMFVLPLEISEVSSREGPWVYQHRSGDYGGVHHRRVDNTLVLRIQFKTTFEGEFRRTYEIPEGVWRNVRRVTPALQTQESGDGE